MKRVGSLFSGGGMLDVAVHETLGVEPAWFIENDPAASKVLAHHFLDVPNYGDVATVDWETVEPVEVLTAGYPCQPFSLAGHRGGHGDERHLWPHIVNVISRLRPAMIFLENVRGHLTLGFSEVLGDLSALNYEVCWTVLRASDCGAPHERARIFILARDREADVGVEPTTSHPLAVCRSGQWWEPSDGLFGPIEYAAPLPSDEMVFGGHIYRLPPPERDPLSHALLPTPTASDRFGPGESGEGGADLRTVVILRLQPDSWITADGTDYEPAIRRWESILHRPALAPTRVGVRGSRQLSAEFTEFLMGWPQGWVTDVPGLSCGDQIKICGNGCVPHQSTVALRYLIQKLPERAT